MQKCLILIALSVITKPTIFLLQVFEEWAVGFEGCAVIVEAAEDSIFVVIEDCIIGVVVDIVEVGWDDFVAVAVDNATAVVCLDDSAVFKDVSCPFIARRDNLPAKVITEAV